MKVLLLGATGLLGHNVLRCLVANGHTVNVLVRRADGIRMTVGEWRTFVGSPLDQGMLRQAAEGCEAVINCAGVTDMSLLHLEDYLPVNRDLPQMIVKVMEELGIKTLVHTSTVNTIGYGSADRPATEAEPMREPFAGSYYAESKRLGEEVVLEAAKTHREWHVVVINPGYMLGAYDVKPSSGRMLLAGYRKPVMLAPKGGKAFVAVQDVAMAAVNAMTLGKTGERYIITGSSGCYSIKGLYEIQAMVMGYRQKVVELPNWLLLAVGRVGDVLRSMGVRTEMSARNVRLLMVREYYDNRHGLCDLRYKEAPIEEAIYQFYKWREQRIG